MPDESPSTVPLGKVLGAAGAPMTLTYNGKEHPVSPANLRVHDRVEKFVAKLASAELAELKDTLPPEEFEAMRGELGSLIRKGEHKTLGKLWLEQIYADGGARGILIMLHCCLEEARDSAKRPKELPAPIPFGDLNDVLQDSPDAREVLAVMVPDFFRVAATNKRIPKEKRAELETKIDGIAAELLEGFRSPPAS